MNATPPIPIVAMVSMAERAAVDGACGNIVRALGEAGGTPWKCDCRFVPGHADLQNAHAGSILVSSLVLEVDAPEPWTDVEQRLRGIYAGLCARGDPVFICTVLRHTGAGEPDASRRRIRIRRLNLLAAEISREHGAFVIDIDRQLADVGARRLGTDYRLQGAAAADLAGNAIAMEIILNGLDTLASVDVQDRARAMLAEYKSAVALPEIRPNNLMSMGQGRRKQIVTAIIDTDQEAHVGWLIQQVLRRQITPLEASNKLLQAARRRGAKESLAVLASGVVRLIGKRT
ncbi:MAG TPA: hypothetical protein VEN78_23920 [Bradyrhizobium sp.]|nr:hypothetical protein [Bradyrhizobium sp.]